MGGTFILFTNNWLMGTSAALVIKGLYKHNSQRRQVDCRGILDELLGGRPSVLWDHNTKHCHRAMY